MNGIITRGSSSSQSRQASRNTRITTTPRSAPDHQRPRPPQHPHAPTAAAPSSSSTTTSPARPDTPYKQDATHNTPNPHDAHATTTAAHDPPNQPEHHHTPTTTRTATRATSPATADTGTRTATTSDPRLPPLTTPLTLSPLDQRRPLIEPARPRRPLRRPQHTIHRQPHEHHTTMRHLGQQLTRHDQLRHTQQHRLSMLPARRILLHPRMHAIPTLTELPRQPRHRQRSTRRRITVRRLGQEQCHPSKVRSPHIQRSAHQERSEPFNMPRSAANRNRIGIETRQPTRSTQRPNTCR